jgi:hypothetical protein
MVRQQDRKCFVCHKRPRKPLFIDHCHKTGRVRALLCVRCNRWSCCRCFCRHSPSFANRISRPSEYRRSGAVGASSASIYREVIICISNLGCRARVTSPT